MIVIVFCFYVDSVDVDCVFCFLIVGVVYGVIINLIILECGGCFVFEIFDLYVWWVLEGVCEVFF